MGVRNVWEYRVGLSQKGGRMINMYNCDCMEFMAACKDKQYELAIVDPPYGIGDFQTTGDANQYKKHKEKKYQDVKKWNMDIPTPEYFSELKRISVNQIIWGANYYNCFESGALVWWKNIGHPNMSQCEIASLSFQKKVDFIHINWASGFYRTISEGETIHPCQKPVALYKWLLNNYAKQGDKILDTHGGSMSIAIACYDLGFDLDLYEIDKEYFEAGKTRLEKHMSQLQMFHEEQKVIIQDKIWR